MKKILLTYGKHKANEVIAYRMGKFLERYQNEDFKVRECYTSIPWKFEFFDFTGLPEVYLSKLIERPDLHIDLHQGIKKFTTSYTDGHGKMVVKKPSPTMNQVSFEFVTPEIILRDFCKKEKGFEISRIYAKLTEYLIKFCDLFGPRFIGLEVLTPPLYEPTQIEIEGLSSRSYEILVQLPKDNKQLNQFVFEFNEKEEDRVWYEAFGFREKD